jgi:hypothetical protein
MASLAARVRCITVIMKNAQNPVSKMLNAKMKLCGNSNKDTVG